MSSDDRMVKEKFKEAGTVGSSATVLTKHPLQPTDEESFNNPGHHAAQSCGRWR